MSLVASTTSSASGSAWRLARPCVRPCASPRAIATAIAGPSRPSSLRPFPSSRPSPGPSAADYTHTLTVTSTRNNLLLTYATPRGPVMPTITGGTDKTFKNAGRSTYEAAHQASIKAMERIVQMWRGTGNGEGSENGAGSGTGTTMPKIRIAMKGYAGQGAEAFTQALASPHGADIRRMITRVEDQTAVKIGGTRSRKPRRL